MHLDSVGKWSLVTWIALLVLPLAMMICFVDDWEVCCLLVVFAYAISVLPTIVGDNWCIYVLEVHMLGGA